MPLEALPGALAEVVAFLVGKVLGRSFKLDAKRAQRIGEWIVWGLIATAGITVTILYS